MQLVKYEAACRAVAEAKSIDEIKEITNRAEAARAYARQAKNRSLELDALEIRTRAERRLGEIILQLKTDQLIRVGGPGRGVKDERPPVTLKELGIDGNISGAAQRLAKLPDERFESEVGQWRKSAEVARNVEVPLQRYRVPSIKGDRQKVDHRLGRLRIEPSDPFDAFRAVDGRRIADWRVGELDRIKQLAERTIRCVDALKKELPIANPDSLDTMEMVFRNDAVLHSLLTGVWNAARITPSTSDIEDTRRKISLDRRKRVCEQCSKEFVLKKVPHNDRASEGKFCSRGCVNEWRKARHKCGT